MLRALSLTRPWPWAFIHGHKRIENRSWSAPFSAIGTTIALHAAKSWDEDGCKFIADATGIDVPPRKEHPDSVIFGLCRVVGCASTWSDAAHRMPCGQKQWFFGPYGWLIDDFTALPEPVPIKGALGLWDVAIPRLKINGTPDDVDLAIRTQISGNFPELMASRLFPAKKSNCCQSLWRTLET